MQRFDIIEFLPQYYDRNIPDAVDVNFAVKNSGWIEDHTKFYFIRNRNQNSGRHILNVRYQISQYFLANGIETRTFHRNGQIWYRYFAGNGCREGEYKVWHEYGYLTQQEFYLKSNRNGNIKDGWSAGSY